MPLDYKIGEGTRSYYKRGTRMGYRAVYTLHERALLYVQSDREPPPRYMVSYIGRSGRTPIPGPWFLCILLIP